MKYHKPARILSAILALALMLAIVPQFTLPAYAAETSGKCGDNLTWRFDEATGTLTVSGYGEMYDYGPVWREYIDSIRSVALPDGLTNIGADAFDGCTKLENVVVPEGVTSIQEAAFANCTGLKSVTFPGSLRVIGHAVFYNCGALEQVSIPEGLEAIDFHAFHNCDALVQIRIPSSVRHIGHRAFEGCSRLEHISVSDGITKMGEGVLSGTAYFNDLANWTGSLLYLGNWVIASKDEIVEADIRPGTVGIADHSFLLRSHLERITVPDGLVYIGSYAFNSCERLDGFRLPDSVTRIGPYAFEGTQYYNDLYNWSGPVLYLGDWLIAHDQITDEVRIRPGIRAIADSVFQNADQLSRVELPDSLEIIGESAFEITGLTELELPYGVTSIGREAFASCDSLVRLTLPDSVTSIGYEAFAWCRNLTEITIPESVMRIGDCAFLQCDSLKSVLILSRDCVIDGGEWTLGDPETTTVFGYSGSTAEAYAKANGYLFKDCEKCPFLDVNMSDYYAEPIAWAIEEGVANGTAPFTFSPDSTCTRAQVAAFLWRAAGFPKPARNTPPLQDIERDAYYFDAVRWALEKGITTGTSTGIFSPDSGCTRAQAVTFLWRAMGKPAPENARNPFADVKAEQYYTDAVLWAVEKGITKGASETRFSPDSTCTRAQIVTFLYRACKDDWERFQAGPCEEHYKNA